MIVRYLFVFVCLFVIISFASSQAKVGLILSGGGSKGLAHVGVIKALEENNIPIDYIGGTSMGAIIGGLYAAGYSPQEIEAIVTSPDFQTWAYGRTEPNQLYFFKKNNPNASWLAIDIKYDSTLSPAIPSNFVNTHQMDFAFMKLFAQPIAVSNYNFDNLFVPFRCVGSDIYRDIPHVFKSGDIATTLRASMTVPFYFKPVVIDGEVYFDGGIYNNFPSDVIANDFKPDYFIGSKVASNSMYPKVDNVLEQIENLVTSQTNFELPDSNGILIEPPVFHLGLMDFDKVQELIDSGYHATLSMMDSIKKIIPVRSDSILLNKKRQDFKNKFHHLRFKNVFIEGLNRYQAYFIIKSFKTKEEYMTIEKVREVFFKLIQDDRIKAVYPRAKYNPYSGFFDLYLTIELDKKFEAQMGGNVASLSINQAFASIDFKHLSKRAYTFSANTYFGRFYSSGSLFGRVDFPGRVPFYVDGNITYNRWDFFKSSSELFFEDVRPSYLIQHESNATFSIGFPMHKHGKVYAGGSIGNIIDEYYQKTHVFKTDTADFSYFNFNSYHAVFELDNTNYLLYPNSGTRIFLGYQYIINNERHVPGSTSQLDNEYRQNHHWFQIKYKMMNFKPIIGKFVLGFDLEMYYANKLFYHNYTSTMLCSSQYSPTPHSKTMFLPNYRANAYIGTGIIPIFKISRRFEWRNNIHVFLPYQKILSDDLNMAYYGKAFSDFHFVASTALIYQSPIGPGSISFSYYDKENTHFYFLFHFGYILFNKKGIF